MCKFIDILDKVNPEHRVRFIGWSSDFIENETWPSVLEFRVYKTFTDANGIVNVVLTEGDDVTWDAGCLQLFYKDCVKDANDIKFFFNDCELIPSFGDVGHSDKITHINFEPKNKIGMKEELYKWYPIVDEGEYWTDYDTSVYRDDIEKINTVVTNGTTLYTYEECPLGWGTMAKSGNWKYMRIKLD